MLAYLFATVCLWLPRHSRPLTRRRSLAPLVALEREAETPTASIAAEIDAACEASMRDDGGDSQSPAAFFRQLVATEEELRDIESERAAADDDTAARQAALAQTYSSLKLDAFGSVTESPIPGRTVTVADQLRLTGLPTKAFAPRGTGFGTLFAGAATALGLVLWTSPGVEELRLVGLGAGALLLLDSASGGVGVELATRALSPGYRRKIVEHEAGHFLTAYLLGCPVEACLLDPLRAATDPRFQGAAGTVFFDPLLADAMRAGSVPRSSVDRYSVVVMAGIAAEAELHGQAEGGRADEQALVRLLTSLDGGRSWDYAKITNQARWAASSAALCIRAHRPAFDALVEALAAGRSVGTCVMAIEEALRGGGGEAQLGGSGAGWNRANVSKEST